MIETGFQGKYISPPPFKLLHLHFFFLQKTKLILYRSQREIKQKFVWFTEFLSVLEEKDARERNRAKYSLSLTTTAFASKQQFPRKSKWHWQMSTELGPSSLEHDGENQWTVQTRRKFYKISILVVRLFWHFICLHLLWASFCHLFRARVRARVRFRVRVMVRLPWSHCRSSTCTYPVPIRKVI